MINRVVGRASFSAKAYSASRFGTEMPIILKAGATQGSFAMSVKAQRASDIQFESKIVWLTNIEAIPYVREHFDTSCPRRKGKLKYQSYEIIGYAELEDNAPNSGRRGCFARRVFWLAKHDRYYEPDGVYQQGCPIEAIDPLTVFPKVLGQITIRAWNGTLP